MSKQEKISQKVISAEWAVNSYCFEGCEEVRIV